MFALSAVVASVRPNRGWQKNLIPHQETRQGRRKILKFYFTLMTAVILGSRCDKAQKPRDF